MGIVWLGFPILGALCPMGTVWLGFTNSGAWPWIIGYTYVHTLLWNGLSYIHSGTGDTHIYVINHIDNAIRKGQSELLLLNSWVGHSLISMHYQLIKKTCPEHIAFSKLSRIRQQ
jgi:hypothetical protein